MRRRNDVGSREEVAMTRAIDWPLQKAIHATRTTGSNTREHATIDFTLLFIIQYIVVYATARHSDSLT